MFEGMNEPRVKGSAEVSVNGTKAITIDYKNPGEFVSANVKIADGTNKISVKFTPDAKQDLGEGKELANLSVGKNGFGVSAVYSYEDQMLIKVTGWDSENLKNTYTYYVIK